MNDNVKRKLRDRKIERMALEVCQLTWHIFRCEDEFVSFYDLRNPNKVRCSCLSLDDQIDGVACIHIEAVLKCKAMKDKRKGLS